MIPHRRHARALFVLATLAFSPLLKAGPPFLTDDPEPVELHHWEVYLATMDFRTSEGWTATVPHVEINYGVLPDVQLHLIAPFAYSKAPGESGHYGYGDTELGVKYRFMKETDFLPQTGIFPLVELPTGNHDLGLGNGRAQVFLPVWLQKSFGKWTTYGGGGWWYNPGDADNRDFWFTGWELQRKITETFTLGGEIYHKTADTVGGSSQTGLNLGLIWDLSETCHLLASAGHTVQGPSEFTGYLALQFTFGPEEKKGASGK